MEQRAAQKLEVAQWAAEVAQRAALKLEAQQAARQNVQWPEQLEMRVPSSLVMHRDGPDMQRMGQVQPMVVASHMERDEENAKVVHRKAVGDDKEQHMEQHMEDMQMGRTEIRNKAGMDEVQAHRKAEEAVADKLHPDPHQPRRPMMKKKRQQQQHSENKRKTSNLRS